MRKNKDTSKPIYYKAASGEIETSEQSRIVTGYFAKFDNIDSDNDVIRKGAFAKSISERGPSSTSNRQIKYLHQHNIQEPVGVIKQLIEDDFGLKFEAELEKTPFGDTILERYKNGTYREHSIGFYYVWNSCDWAEMDVTTPDGSKASVEIFECKELNLFEGSVVTFGANSETPFTGFKGSREEVIEYLQDEFKFLVKHAPNYDYELRLRQYYHNEITRLKSLAATSIKEEKKKSNNDDKARLLKSYLNY